MADIYEDRSYGEGTIGFGDKPGIVVVDLQRAFTDADYPTGGAPLIERATENTARLLDAAWRAGVPVASCYVGYNNTREMPHWKVGAIKDLIIGSPACELDPRIHDADYDVVLRKTGPSIFFDTSVQSFMTKERVDTMIVTGCVTSGCVRASIIDAFSYGYRTMVPEDCVGDHDEAPHLANLEDVRRRYADIVMADDCIDYIEDWRKRNS